MMASIEKKKATLQFLVIFLFAFLLSGCVGDNGYILESNGKEEVYNYSGEFELDVHLLPDDDFSSRFSNVSEYYHFIAKYKNYFSIVAPESLIVLIQYDPSIYAEAKAYCLDNMNLLDIGIPNYNGYRFLENIAKSEADSLGANLGFPHWFNIFAYNDMENTLAFMGHYSPNYSLQDKDEVLSSWSSFVEEYFPELGKVGSADADTLTLGTAIGNHVSKESKWEGSRCQALTNNNEWERFSHHEKGLFRLA